MPYKDPEKRRAADRASYRRNHTKMLAKNKKYREANREYFRSYMAEYGKRPDVKEKDRINHKKYREANPERVRLQNAKCNQRPGAKEKRREAERARLADPIKYEAKLERTRAWRKNNRPHSREYTVRRRATDPAYRLRIILRNRLNDAIRDGQKTGSAVRNLGCTIPEFMQYIEARFQEGMTWTNWGHDTWHIDHIRPLSSFDLTDVEQFCAACHYTNMQPLWAKDNMTKSDKWVDPAA